MRPRHYLIIDIGTGNVRVALADPAGNIIKVATDTVHYERDQLYEDATFFDPDRLWEQIIKLCKEVLAVVDPGSVAAVTTSSQREGIVLLDAHGNTITGMPNIDHRGREFQDMLQDKDRVYALTGRYPTSLFSAFKVVGFTRKHPAAGAKIAHMLSISDWALFRLCGVMGYEHSQASETLLYDVAARSWSEELCACFGISPAILPRLVLSGEALGEVLPGVARSMGLSPGLRAVAGGADTQLAVMSTIPGADDVVIVSGTTTPVVKIVSRYVTDSARRTWTNSHTLPGFFILETNAGVTGLNLQRYKAIFYPNESYDVMEAEILSVAESGGPQCWAALGSLIAGEESPLLRGGFIFPAPIHHELSRGQFAFALVWDLACSIYENYLALCGVSPHKEAYIWGCGGGMQSLVLRQFLANLTGKELRIRNNYRQATVSGGAAVCSRALGLPEETAAGVSGTRPQPSWDTAGWYRQWKENRNKLKEKS
ncbi:MAG: sugar kinase [Cytophagaceae bacterium SCN 52-12]|nr:MAG: sugar kinase [Cytophagaceae bacterium SCN 52-12]